MKQITNKGNEAIIMGCPMGPADFSAGDFEARNPSAPLDGPVLFGIDPVEAVQLTVVNQYDQEVVHTFQPGPNPYLIRAIKEDATVTTVVNYFI